jgi:hypothetical protein
MKKQSIKSHLAPYSIYKKRMTTINHAFASAIAPVDVYDANKLDAALRVLDQDPDSDLKCVYCGNLAETWDHLIALVKQGQLNGYGHQLGNLVPCCKNCNSKKGAKDWNVYLREFSEDSILEQRRRRISSYLEQNAALVNPELAAEKFSDDWKRYNEIKRTIHQLMKNADDIADRLRSAVITKGK